MSNIKDEIARYTIMGLTYCRDLGSSKRCRALWDVCGKSMLQRVIKTTITSKYVDRMYVATESRRIGEEAEKYGAKVIYRPIDDVLDYPRDFSKGIEKKVKPRSLVHQGFVYLARPWHYSLHYLFDVEHYVPDIILIVSVDHPLIKTESIDRIIEAFFADEEASSAVAVYKTEPKFFTENSKTNRLFPMFHDTWQNIDRQDYPNVYKHAGIIIGGGWIRAWSGEQKIAWTVVSKEEGLTVHNEEDLFLANCYVKRRLEKETQ